MQIAVIVTTYNRLDALRTVLEGYAAQSDDQFEVIVADDGSTEETGRFVQQLAERSKVPIRHVWHEDQGFRVAAIRNRAVGATRAEYIILTDGDCVPSIDFVCQHRQLAERGRFLSGSRVLLSQRLTQRVIEECLPIYRWRWTEWLGLRLSGDINRLLPVFSLPDGLFRKSDSRGWEGVMTCNLSVWRDDIITVNGFDERYQGWGREDSDFVIRLYRAGVGYKSARLAAPVFHLWHPENDKSRLANNQRRLDEVLQSARVRAEVGFDQCRS
jgi:glycosyltransferase involved in cell wall biosynthesis